MTDGTPEPIASETTEPQPLLPEITARQEMRRRAIRGLPVLLGFLIVLPAVLVWLQRLAQAGP